MNTQVFLGIKRQAVRFAGSDSFLKRSHYRFASRDYWLATPGAAGFAETSVLSSVKSVLVTAHKSPAVLLLVAIFVAVIFSVAVIRVFVGIVFFGSIVLMAV